MADLLKNLPTVNKPPTPEETDLVESLLSMTGESQTSDNNSTGRWTILLKATLLITALFALVSSPLISGLLSKIPGLSNSVVTFLIQAIIFMVLCGLSLWWLSR